MVYLHRSMVVAEYFFARVSWGLPETKQHVQINSANDWTIADPEIPKLSHAINTSSEL